MEWGLGKIKGDLRMRSIGHVDRYVGTFSWSTILEIF